MGEIVRLTDVPTEEVAQLVQIHEDAGATVSKTLQSDGRYTVVATYPNGDGAAT